MGATIAALGAAASSVQLPINNALLALVVVAALYDLLRLPLWRFQPHEGVPGRWRAWHPLAAMGAYGVILGAGLFTPFTAAAMYAFVALVMVAADPLAGALIFASYGAMRALVSMGVAGITLSGCTSEVSSTLQRAKDHWRPILGATAATAVALLIALPRP